MNKPGYGHSDSECEKCQPEGLTGQKLQQRQDE